MTRKRGVRLIALVGALALLAVIAAGPGTGGAQALRSRYCSPVVVKAPGGGFDSAAVLVTAGKVDCEKSRKLIGKALSPQPYSERQIAGWTCSTTTRASSGHLYGAGCALESGQGGEREAVRSTTPRPCPSCKSARD